MATNYKPSLLHIQVDDVGDLICTHLTTPTVQPPLYGERACC